MLSHFCPLGTAFDPLGTRECMRDALSPCGLSDGPKGKNAECIVNRERWPLNGGRVRGVVGMVRNGGGVGCLRRPLIRPASQVTFSRKGEKGVHSVYHTIIANAITTTPSITAATRYTRNARRISLVFASRLPSPI